jgi:hypothetical protein
MSYFTLKDGQRLYYEDKGHGSDNLIEDFFCGV